MWIDKFFLKYRVVRDNGIDVPERSATNYIGATVEDDPDNDATIVTFTGSSGGGTIVTQVIGDAPITATGVSVVHVGITPATETDYGSMSPEQVTAIEEFIASGVTEASHEALRQLIHFIDNGPANGFATGAYRAVTGTVFPSAVTWWTSSGMTAKIVEKLITYTGPLPTTIQWKMYDTDGTTVLATVTDSVVYSGVFETSRTRTIA